MKRGSRMYSINWDTQSTYTANSFIADIGDLRIILKDRKNSWQLYMGIRVYSKDGKQSMVRPTVLVTQFAKPCDADAAKALANEYIDRFISSILNNLSM